MSTLDARSLALGLMVASGEPGLALLAAVVVGNVTEPYGAVQPIVAGGRPRRFAVGLLAGIAVLLAAMTFVGGTLGTTMPGTPIDDFYGAVLAHGLMPSSEPRKDRSGRREFLLDDPDGYQLAFFAK
ncbi:MAG: hypothetical protein ACRDTM_04555 [Micromonosporaceae bacterium]